MSLERMAFLFGALELGFIVYGTRLIPWPLFLAWSGGCCLLLMSPHVRAVLRGKSLDAPSARAQEGVRVDGRSRRPETVGTKEASS
jgi:hypothetical protein